MGDDEKSREPCADGTVKFDWTGSIWDSVKRELKIDCRATVQSPHEIRVLALKIEQTLNGTRTVYAKTASNPHSNHVLQWTIRLFTYVPNPGTTKVLVEAVVDDGSGTCFDWDSKSYPCA